MKTKTLKKGLAAIIITMVICAPIAFAKEYVNVNEIEIQSEAREDIIQINGLRSETFERKILLINHSDSTKNISLSILDDNKKLSSPLSSWIKLKDKNLDLAPHSTTETTFTISYPELAGVGTHYGTLLTSHVYDTDTQNRINIENGIKIKAQVLGEKHPKFKIINNRLEEETSQHIFKTTLVNSGNTNLSGKITVTNQASPNQENSQEINLFPGEDRQISLTLKKETFGPERIIASFDINNSAQTFVLKDDFTFPTEIPISLAIIAILISIELFFNKKKVLAALIIACSLTTILGYSSDAFKTPILANVLANGETAYLTTIKWGTFNQTPLPEWVKTNWVGRFTTENGDMYLIEKLHNEKSDQISINSTKDTLNFKNVTGPDNDGVIILVRNTNNRGGNLTLHNNLTGEEINIDLADTLKSPKYFNYKQQLIEVKSEVAPDIIKTIQPNGSIEIPLNKFWEETSALPIITEIESTADQLITDLESTAEQTPLVEIESTYDQQKLQDEISLLKEIIEETPSSPDILSEVILNSIYVEEIVSENDLTKVKGSSKLINKLKDTPLTIQEITASPDINFVFVPNEKIKLTPQTFSFSETKTSSQELDEIVFVQKKGKPWNIYMSISDFYSVSGNHTIPAGNVTVSPGDINMISQSGKLPLLEGGKEKKIKSKKDEVTLVSIIPLEKGETTFSIKPRISVSIPPNTPPGLYKAEITIRSL